MGFAAVSGPTPDGQHFQCIAAAIPEATANDVRIISTRCGTINDVIQFVVGGEEYILRIRTREEYFRYEREASKEPIVARFLASPRAASSCASEDLEGIARSIAAMPIARAITHPLGADILIYDHSRQTIPFLWTIQKFLDGRLLSDTPVDSAYRALGNALALLHRHAFHRHTTSFFGEWKSAADWFEVARAEIIRRLQDTPFKGRHPGPPASPRPATLALVHNDLQPSNVIIANGCARLIDWDNAQIAPRELDLVKLKHWTAMDLVSGTLTPHARLYAAFLAGYAEMGGSYDPELMYFCELLWLTRIHTFEKERAGEHGTPPPFPPAEYYLPEIARVLGAR